MFGSDDGCWVIVSNMTRTTFFFKKLCSGFITRKQKQTPKKKEKKTIGSVGNCFHFSVIELSFLPSCSPHSTRKVSKSLRAVKKKIFLLLKTGASLFFLD